MNEEDFGISELLPQLSQAKVEAVKKRLQDLGVPDEITLTDVTKDDLMKEGLLKSKAAGILIDGWHNNKKLSGNPNAISTRVCGNVATVEAAGGNITKTHYGNQATNFGTVQGDFVGGGKKTTVETNLKNAKITVTGGMHTGEGDIIEGGGGILRTRSKNNDGPEKVSVSTNMDEATVQTKHLLTGKGDINLNSR